MSRRGLGATPWRLFSAVVGVSVLLPALGMWWASWLAHDAVQHRATAGNAATARAVAAQVSREYADRIAIADDLLVLLSNGARFNAGMADAARLNNPFCRVNLLASDGAALSSLPLASCASRAVRATDLGNAGRYSLPPAIIEGTPVGTVVERLNPTEQAAVGTSVRWLEVQFRVDQLFTPVHVDRTGSYAVVDRTSGVILAAPLTSTVGQRVKAAAGVRLLAGGHAGVAQAYGPLLHKHLLMAYQPVTGTPFGVFITLPTGEAFAQANHLRDLMLLALAVLAVAGFAAAVAVASVVSHRNRQLVSSVERMHSLATHDALTGLANRGESSRLLEQHLALAARGGLDGVGLLFLDVDRFKDLNDRFGHVGADRVLCAITESMREQLRPSDDLLARFGGDEFVVIAPGLTSVSGAQALAERLRAAVAATAVIDESSGMLVADVTVSVGVAVSTSSSTADSLLHDADQAMYRAKRAGGNTVVTAATALPLPI